MFKLENVKDLTTTVPAVIGSICVILAMYGLFTAEEGKTLAENVSTILLGVYSIILYFVKAEK